eukprot:COSAG06_NODE_1288_length_9990_cov_17.463351_11_plen_72_part_00
MKFVRLRRAMEERAPSSTGGWDRTVPINLRATGVRTMGWYSSSCLHSSREASSVAPSLSSVDTSYNFDLDS